MGAHCLLNKKRKSPLGLICRDGYTEPTPRGRGAHSLHGAGMDPNPASVTELTAERGLRGFGCQEAPGPNHYRGQSCRRLTEEASGLVVFTPPSLEPLRSKKETLKLVLRPRAGEPRGGSGPGSGWATSGALVSAERCMGWPDVLRAAFHSRKRNQEGTAQRGERAAGWGDEEGTWEVPSSGPRPPPS